MSNDDEPPTVGMDTEYENPAGDLEDDDAGSNETTEADETPSSEAADALETAEGYLFEAVDSIIKEIEITWAKYSTVLAYYSTVRPSSSFWNHAWEVWKYVLFLCLLLVLAVLTLYFDGGLLLLVLVVMTGVTVFLYKKAS